MPFYEYQCSKCSHQLEVLQKISDAPLVTCPICNQATLKKMVSAAAFRLKGTGWYETDFKNNKNDAKNDAKNDKSKNPESSSESSSESKESGAATTTNNDKKTKTDANAATNNSKKSTSVAS